MTVAVGWTLDSDVLMGDALRREVDEPTVTNNDHYTGQLVLAGTRS